MSDDDAIRALAEDRRIPQTHLERWLGMDAASRHAFLEIAQSLRLRTGQIVVAIEELDEICVRDTTTPREILAREAIRRIVSRTGSAPGRSAAFIDELNAIRFPRLRRTLEDLNAAVAALKLPRGASVVLPKSLGSDELTIALKFCTGDELKRMLAALEAARPAIERILDKLSGSDEV